MQALAGRHAVVTGSTSGAGFGIAATLARPSALSGAPAEHDPAVIQRRSGAPRPGRFDK